MHIFVSVAKELAAGRDELEEKRSGSSGIQHLTCFLPGHASLFSKNKLLQLFSFICSPGKEGNTLQGHFHFHFFYCLRSSSVPLKKSVYERGLDKFGCKI